MRDGDPFLAPHVLKFYTLPGVLLATLVSALVAGLSFENWHTTGHVYKWVENHRASAQIIVHIASWVLGTLQIASVYAITRHRLNKHVAAHDVPLNDLQLYSSINGRMFDMSLPKRLLCISALASLLLSVPSLLWTGAISPILIHAGGQVAHLSVPVYSEASAPYWNFTCPYCWIKGSAGTPYKKDGFIETQTSKGLFGPDLKFGHLGLLLEQAETASSPKPGKAACHTKIDQSGYTYIGRSYGVGGAVGLSETFEAGKYEYFEDGYTSEVKCTYNTSMLAGVQYLWVPDTENYNSSFQEYLPSVVKPEGFLPNSGPNKIVNAAATSYDIDTTVVSLLSCGPKDHTNVDGGYYYGFIAGLTFQMLAKLQCQAEFSPTRFRLSVDTFTKTIQVEPQASGSSHFDIDPTGTIKQMAFDQPSIFSIVGADPYMSQFGEAFYRNLGVNVLGQDNATMEEMVDSSAQYANIPPHIFFQGLSDSFESILDNSLLSFSMNQMINARDMKDSEVHITSIPAVRLGEPGYIYVLFGVSCCILLGVALECFRTKCWNDLTRFDVLNLKSAVIAASEGGMAIGRQAHCWMGKGDDKDAGEILVKLEFAATSAPFGSGDRTGMDGRKHGSRIALRAREDDDDIDEAKLGSPALQIQKPLPQQYSRIPSWSTTSTANEASLSTKDC